jgi:hypothetical protein
MMPLEWTNPHRPCPHVSLTPFLHLTDHPAPMCNGSRRAERPSMPSLRDTRIYIYTIPKSGTYLMSGFVHALGFPSTGWHIAQSKTLETLSVDTQTNAREPSTTAVSRSYLNAFKSVPSGHHAFGHFSPLYLTPGLIVDRGYRFIAIKRHPREVLVSEFIDFRHRRTDVAWVSEARIPDPHRAFEAYLAQHGPVIRHICIDFLLMQQTAASPLYRELMREPRHLLLDFARFTDPETGPGVAAEVAAFLGSAMPDTELPHVWAAALNANNKTKTAGLKLPYARASLWTDDAEAHYQRLGFHKITDDLECAG